MQYPQLDLEEISLDFGLRRFCQYLVGSPNVIITVTDHKPLCSIFNGHKHSIFNGHKQGSILAEPVKMRLQDINFHVVYRQGKLNQTDYMSPRGKPFIKLSQHERDEMNDLNNLLHFLHTTPVTDKLNFNVITEESTKDVVLQEIISHIRKGYSWLPKQGSAMVNKFQKIHPELMVSPKGLLLKGDRIVLPESLQENAIELAHHSNHPRYGSMERCLQFHFFFHEMLHKVDSFFRKCKECTAFSSKKTVEPVKPHNAPNKCWETVAVDLFFVNVFNWDSLYARLNSHYRA